MVSSDIMIGMTSQDAGPSSSAALLPRLVKSPPRRHKSRHSRASSGSLDAIIPGPVNVASPNRTRPRPGFQRTITAPAAPLTLSAAEAEDDVGSRLAPPTAATMTTAAIPHSLVGNSLSPPNGSSAGAGATVPMIMSVNGVVPSTQLGLSSGQSQPPTNLYQQVQEMSRKRIATLDYLRKA